MSVFVTVGTTSFDPLVRALDQPELQALLRRLGYRTLRLQIGRGEYEPSISSDEGAGALQVEFYRFKPSLRDDMSWADLVISHAGAGSCLEALELRRKLLVVVNDALMHNHQLELARALSTRGGHCVMTRCAALDVGLREVCEAQLERLPPPQTHRFAEFMDDVMGYSIAGGCADERDRSRDAPAN